MFPHAKATKSAGRSGYTIVIKMTKILAICGTKGGVGKTTLTANLAALLAESGSVLMIDADPQPSLSYYYELTRSPRAENGLCHLLTQTTPAEPVPTTVSHLDIIVSDDPSAQLESQLLHRADGRLRLLQATKQYGEYQYILIDTPGAVNVLVENAMLAADLCLSPIPPQILAAQEFVRGTLQIACLLQELNVYGIAPGELVGLIYRHDRTLDSKRILQEIRSLVSNRNNTELPVTLLSTVVPSRVVYRAAATRRIPVHEFEPKRRYGVSARTTMEQLRDELLGKTQQNSH